MNSGCYYSLVISREVCIAKRVAGNGVNSNFWLRCEHDSQGAFYCKAFLSVL